MSSTFANGLSIVHKGDGQTNTAAPPDVCKTPSPAGPVPIPYVNVAMNSDLDSGTSSVKIAGNAVAIASSCLSTSTGDEPGTAGGGIISSKTKGKMTWGSVSANVLFEGKGVARFTDVTQHNGNTFNSAFVEIGGTGLAYGDDVVCEVCHKSLDDHRVHETSTVEAMAGAILMGLLEKVDPQRPIINEHQRLKLERDLRWKEDSAKIKPMEDQLKVLKESRQKLVSQLSTAVDKSAVSAELNAIMSQHTALEIQRKALSTERIAVGNEFGARMQALKAQLTGQNVLVNDDSTGIYTKGYMVGALVCKCPANPKKLAACSGPATPGFTTVVSEVGFTQVEAFAMSPRQADRFAKMDRKKWDCAAPKLLQAGGANGHKVQSMSEQWFSPIGDATVTVKYVKDGEVTERSFSSGETVPSCEVCQKLTPEMLCENHKPCA